MMETINRFGQEKRLGCATDTLTPGMEPLARALLLTDDIVIIGHISPDGDSLGSGLAAMRALEGLGKRARVVCEDDVPKMYQFLPGANTVLKPEKVDFAPGCVLFVDVASSDRAGGGAVMALSRKAKLRLTIDHHQTNTGIGGVDGVEGIEVIRGGASSTGELILELLDALGVSLDRELAALVYTAISTDTGNFSFSNTTPEALRAVARCVEAGLAIDEINRRLFRSRSVARTKLIGAGLSAMRIVDGGRIAYIQITQSMMDSCQAGREDTEGLVNYLAEMEGVQACFIAEQRTGETKLSMRSSGAVDVAQVAQSMGGGGHACAAGVTLKLDLDGATYKVLDALTRALGR